VQLVGRLRGESDLLAAAAVFENARDVVSRWPDVEASLP
jgi:aspartyl-tRNA(Asn)/glutamyl-tRNA(Gln) amidotransferase subunit A